jgi:hypothetical protein
MALLVLYRKVSKPASPGWSCMMVVVQDQLLASFIGCHTIAAMYNQHLATTAMQS